VHTAQPPAAREGPSRRQDADVSGSAAADSGSDAAPIDDGGDHGGISVESGWSRGEQCPRPRREAAGSSSSRSACSHAGSQRGRR